MQTYIPPAPLSDYVEMFWYWAGYSVPHAYERILPHGLIEITLELSETPFRIFDIEHGEQMIHGAMAAGSRSRHFIVDTSQSQDLLSVWFKPGGVPVFFGVSGRELHNQHIALDDLWGRSEATELYDRLMATASTYARFLILEELLLRRLHTAKERHRAVHYALPIFQTIPHMRTIQAIVDDIALSPNRFIQLFAEDTGLTPKQFCRVQRFKHVLDEVADAGQTTVNWIDIALSCGYYDQSHLINDFQTFAGISPTAYLPQSREHNKNLPVSKEC